MPQASQGALGRKLETAAAGRHTPSLSAPRSLPPHPTACVWSTIWAFWARQGSTIRLLRAAQRMGLCSRGPRVLASRAPLTTAPAAHAHGNLASEPCVREACVRAVKVRKLQLHTSHSIVGVIKYLYNSDIVTAKPTGIINSVFVHKALHLISDRVPCRSALIY